MLWLKLFAARWVMTNGLLWAPLGRKRSYDVNQDVIVIVNIRRLRQQKGSVVLSVSNLLDCFMTQATSDMKVIVLVKFQAPHNLKRLTIPSMSFTSLKRGPKLPRSFPAEASIDIDLIHWHIENKKKRLIVGEVFLLTVFIDLKTQLHALSEKQAAAQALAWTLTNFGSRGQRTVEANCAEWRWESPRLSDVGVARRGAVATWWAAVVTRWTAVIEPIGVIVWRQFEQREVAWQCRNSDVSGHPRTDDCSLGLMLGVVNKIFSALIV